MKDGRHVDNEGRILWLKDGVLPKEDGPARINKEGIEEWWLNGERHRVDGPAYVNTKSDIYEWWQNGKPHREDGPAVRVENGSNHWYYFKGQEYPHIKNDVQWLIEVHRRKRKKERK